MDLNRSQPHELNNSDDDEDENITLFELKTKKLKRAAEKYLAGPLAPASLPTSSTTFEDGRGDVSELENEEYSNNDGPNVEEEMSELDKLAWSQATQFEEVIQTFEQVCSWQSTLSPLKFLRMIQSRIGSTIIANDTLDSGVDSTDLTTTDLEEEMPAIPSFQSQTLSLLSKRPAQSPGKSLQRSRRPSKHQAGQNLILSRTPTPRRSQSKTPTAISTQFEEQVQEPENLDKSPLTRPRIDTLCPEPQPLTTSPVRNPPCSQNSSKGTSRSPKSQLISSPRMTLSPKRPKRHRRRLLTSFRAPLVPKSPSSPADDKVLVPRSLLSRYKKLRRKRKRAKALKKRQEAEALDTSRVKGQH